MLSYLYDLCEGLRRGLSQQSQTERAVQFSDGSGQREGERGVRCTRRRRIFSHGQELTGAIQHGRQHLKCASTHLEGEKRDATAIRAEEDCNMSEGNVVPLARGPSV